METEIGQFILEGCKASTAMPMAHMANLVLSRANMQTPAKIWLEIKSMHPKSLQQLHNCSTECKKWRRKNSEPSWLGFFCKHPAVPGIKLLQHIHTQRNMLNSSHNGFYRFYSIQAPGCNRNQRPLADAPWLLPAGTLLIIKSNLDFKWPKYSLEV